MTQATTPRKPSSTQDTRAPFAALSDVQDQLRFTPVSQFKTFNVIAGDYPLRMSTTVQNVLAVSVCQVLLDSNPTTPAYCTGVSWVVGKDAGDVDIQGLNGLTTGTKYRVRLEIRGSR